MIWPAFIPTRQEPAIELEQVGVGFNLPLDLCAAAGANWASGDKGHVIERVLSRLRRGSV